MKIHVLLAAVAVSLCLSCRTKQNVTDVHVGAFSEHFQRGSSRLLMNDVITWFDVSVSDSDTTYTPKAMAKRCLSLEQEDTISISTFDSLGSKKVSNEVVKTTSRDTVPYLVFFKFSVIILILLLLFIFFLLKR